MASIVDTVRGVPLADMTRRLMQAKQHFADSTLDDVVQWSIVHCQGLNRMHIIKVRTASRMVIGCPSSDCSYNIPVSTHKDGGVVIAARGITLNASHSCMATPQRRQYNTRDLVSTWPVLKDFVPSQTGTGDTKQLRKTAKQVGLNLEARHAYNVLNDIKNDGLDAHVASYHALVPYVAALRLADPAGTYDLEIDNSGDGAPRFVFLFFCSGCAKAFWQCVHTRRVFAQDGAHTKGPIPLVYLNAVSKDGNNSLRTLCWGLGTNEDGPQWEKFTRKLILALRLDRVYYNTCVLSDFQKGITSGHCEALRKEGNLFLSRCVKHMIKNMQVAKVPVPKKAAALIYQLSHAPSSEKAKFLKDKLQQDFPRVANHLAQMKGEFEECHFLDASLCR
jgi:hypothetical protein